MYTKRKKNVLKRNKNVHKEETKMYLKKKQTKMYLKKKQKCT